MAAPDLPTLRKNLTEAGFDDQLLSALSDAATLGARGRPTAPREPDRELLMHAALSGTFLPRQLGPPGRRQSRAEIDALLAICETVVVRNGRAWRLRADHRRSALLSAFGTGELPSLIERLPARSDDVPGFMLRRLLAGEYVNPDTLSVEQLESLALVLEWLDGTPLAKSAPNREELRRARRRRELLDPFLTLVGRPEGQPGDGANDRFVGRETEMERLRAYVGILPPEKWPDAVRRGAYSLWSAIGAGPERNEPLRIQGAGGAGKSTLIAKFILEHSRFMLADPVRRDLRLPFVYIDFDRATLTAREPLQLLLDMASQIPIWLPETEPAFDRYRDGLRRALDEQARSGSKLRERETWSELRGHCQEFMNLVEAANKGAAPVLIFFDTFEMVQYNSEAVAGVQGLIASLRNPAGGSWDNVRVIVSGRGSLLEISSKLKPLPIGALSLRATRELIALRSESEGLNLTETQMGALARPLRGSPLDVVIVTAWLKDNPDNASKFIEGVAGDAEIASEGANIDAAAAEARVTALLVRRMINHIATRAVRDLAFPGFVVRAITPDVIREVMMPARECEGAGAAARAQILFRRLRAERWLVHQQGSVLRHRAEVRRSMLRLIRERDRSAFYETNDRAIGFFRRHSEQRVDRAELIYHLLLAEHPLIEEVEALWRADLAPILATGVDDLDGIARDYLRIKLSHSYSVETLASMPDAVLRAVIASSGPSIVDRLGPEAALDLAEQRPELRRYEAGAAFVDEARYRSGRWTELVASTGSDAVSRAVRLLDILAGSRGEPIERRRLANQFRLSSRDPALDELWSDAMPALVGRRSASAEVLHWEALAFAACWQRRNPQVRSWLGGTFPDAVDVAARSCRHAVRLAGSVRSSPAMRVLALLEPEEDNEIIQHLDLKAHFATVSTREFGLFREMLDLAELGDGMDGKAATGDFEDAVREGRTLVASVQSRPDTLILDPRLTANMSRIAERLLANRPRALGSAVRRLLFASHPDWIEPLGLALDRAYGGEVPTRLGWFSTVDALLGSEGSGRRRTARPSGREIVALADEAGHLTNLVDAYRQHIESGAANGQSRAFLYLAAKLSNWILLLDPDRRRAVATAASVPLDQSSSAPPKDDPQKQQWGGLSERNGWRVAATVKASKSDRDWFRIDLKVEPTGEKRLLGPVIFHLHDSFTDPVREVEPRSSREASLKLWAYGAFTVGVLVSQDGTPLELDLAELPDAPKRFRNE